MSLNRRPAKREVAIGLAAVMAWAGVVVTAGVTPAAAAPGTPGTPQPPGVVYTEPFENGVGNTAIQITNYTGAPPVNATYSADPAWLANCDGWIANAAATDPPGSGCGGFWQDIPNMATILGQFAGTGPSNHAMGEESAFVAPGADKVVMETASSIPLSGASRFLTFSVDVAEIGCAGVHSLLKFFLMDGSTAIPTFSSPIEACVNPPTTINGVPVGTYTSNGPVLFSGSSMGLRLVNGQGGAFGNDFAIDNIRVLDVTPQLDKNFSAATVPQHGSVTLTYTITNTTELAVKNGWSFTDTLPAGLIANPASATTNCQGGTASATAGAVSVAGNLAAGQAACTASVQVSAPNPGLYTNCAANITAAVGISLPACTSVRFSAAPTVNPGGPYSGQEGNSVSIAGAVADPDGPSLSQIWSITPASGVDPGATCSFGNASAVSTTVQCTDDGTYTLTLTATDGLNPPVAASTTLTLFNVAPAVTITAPADGVVIPSGTTASFTAPFTDIGTNDTHTCTLNFDDGSPVINGNVAETPGTGTCSSSHPFTAAGTHNVLVTVLDDDGASATAIVRVVVNGRPVVTTGGPYSGQEGTSVSIAGTVTDPDGPSLSQTWTITPASGVDSGATCTFGNASAVATSVTCTDDGTYTLTLTATDGVNPPVAASTTLTLSNVDPTVTITAPADGVVVPSGTTVSFTAPFADPGTNDTHTCTLNFDDGSPVINGTVTESPGSGSCVSSHPFTVAGTHNVLVTVRDDDGGTGTAVVRVIVNAAPVVSAGGPYSGQEGTSVSIAGTVTDPDGPNLSQTWTIAPASGVDPGAVCTFGNASAVSTTVQCTDDGTYTLTLTATDGLNPPVAMSTTLTLFNVAPAVSITAPADGVVVATGAVVSFTAPFTDIGTNDTHTCTLNFDDGSPVANGNVAETPGTGTCSSSHPFTAAGTHNVLVTVFDDDGGSATDVVRVIVNAPPVVNAGGPYSGQEGGAVALTGTVTDPDGPSLTTAWTVVPASGVDAGATCSFGNAAAVSTTVMCTDDGIYTLRLTANDGVNADVVATATLTLTNVAPVVSISAPANGSLFVRGSTVTFTGPFTDAGRNDSHTCRVDFGDGTPVATGTVTETPGSGAGSCGATHAFTALGPHTVVLSVTDDDGGVGTASVVVVIFLPAESWAISASGVVTIPKTPDALCPPDRHLTQVGINVPAVVNTGVLNADCTVNPTTGVTTATSSVDGASLLGGVITISAIQTSCHAGADGVTGSSRVGTINGQPIGTGSGSISIPLVATVFYNQTVTNANGQLFQYAIRVQTLLGQEIILAGCRVG